MNVGRCPPSEADKLIGEDDVAVVVDALRASVTVAALLESGARSVKPVTEVPDVLDDGHVFAGEDHGERIEGFDFGNSPLEILENSDRVEGENVILRTTNGTRCVERVDGAGDIIMGSLVNMDAVLRACLTACDEGDIWFVPAGRHGEQAPEDEYTVMRFVEKIGRITHTVGERMENRRFDILRNDAKKLFRNSDTGKFLREKGYQDDIIYCSKTNILSVSPVLNKNGFVDADAQEEGLTP